MPAASTFAVCIFEETCPVPAADTEKVSRQEIAYLAAFFGEHHLTELLPYALAARTSIERITAGSRTQ
jgi:hypothetical protein